MILLYIDKYFLPLDTVDLSPFSQLIKVLHMEGFGKELFCFIPLSYMALCAYTTLFKIRLFNYYRLVPHRQSDANSIMFSAKYVVSFVCRGSGNFFFFKKLFVSFGSSAVF